MNISPLFIQTNPYHQQLGDSSRLVKRCKEISKTLPPPRLFLLLPRPLPLPTKIHAGEKTRRLRDIRCGAYGDRQHSQANCSVEKPCRNCLEGKMTILIHIDLNSVTLQRRIFICLHVCFLVCFVWHFNQVCPRLPLGSVSPA